MARDGRSGANATADTLQPGGGTTDGHGTILALTVEQTPHSCLRPNDRTDDRTKARYRKVLREAAALATHNALVRRPTIAQDAREGRLRFSYAVVWETPLGGRRQRWDDDGLIGGGLKPIRDGICDRLGIGDADVVTGAVEQSFTTEKQGVVIVVISREDKP